MTSTRHHAVMGAEGLGPAVALPPSAPASAAEKARTPGAVGEVVLTLRTPRGLRTTPHATGEFHSSVRAASLRPVQPAQRPSVPSSNSFADVSSLTWEAERLHVRVKERQPVILVALRDALLHPDALLFSRFSLTRDPL